MEPTEEALTEVSCSEVDACGRDGMCNNGEIHKDQNIEKIQRIFGIKAGIFFGGRWGCEQAGLGEYGRISLDLLGRQWDACDSGAQESVWERVGSFRIFGP